MNELDTRAERFLASIRAEGEAACAAIRAETERTIDSQLEETRKAENTRVERTLRFETERARTRANRDLSAAHGCAYDEVRFFAVTDAAQQGHRFFRFHGEVRGDYFCFREQDSHCFHCAVLAA